MSRKIDWENYRFRCSQLYKLACGVIGITEVQGKRIEELINERETGINVNGNKIRFTPNKEQELADLLNRKANPELPKTMQTELRSIHRAETYHRNFPFTNKYIQKGLAQENEAIVILQEFYMKVKNHNVLLIKNGERLKNSHFSGEPDLRPQLYKEIEINGEIYKNVKIGKDIKNSWDLSTFPFPKDPLIDQYDCQNLGYIDLENADMWLTIFVLANATEQHVHNEKLKWMYALTTQKDGNPESNPDHPYFNEYIKKCKEVERMMIFDFDRFKEINKFHNMEHTREEWMDGGYDIPIEDRVIEKVTMRNESKTNFLKERVEIGREYLKQLDKQ